jgi:suppressor of fused
LRLKAGTDCDEPPAWVLNFLQNLARYVFQSGRVFQCGDFMNANGPIAIDVDTKIRSVAFAEDPELPAIETPNGRVQFIQVVGITDDEELAIKQWATLKALGVFKQYLPLLVTDLGRDSLLSKSDVKRALQDGAIADGSNTSTLFIDQLSWEEERRLLRPALIRITLGARQVVELVSLLPYRIPYRRSFELIGQQAQIAIKA